MTEDYLGTRKTYFDKSWKNTLKAVWCVERWNREWGTSWGWLATAQCRAPASKHQPAASRWQSSPSTPSETNDLFMLLNCLCLTLTIIVRHARTVIVSPSCYKIRIWTYDFGIKCRISFQTQTSIFHSYFGAVVLFKSGLWTLQSGDDDNIPTFFLGEKNSYTMASCQKPYYLQKCLSSS